MINPERMRIYYEFIYPFMVIIAIGIIIEFSIDWLLKWYKKKKVIKHESLEKTN